MYMCKQMDHTITRHLHCQWPRTTGNPSFIDQASGAHLSSLTNGLFMQRAHPSRLANSLKPAL